MVWHFQCWGRVQFPGHIYQLQHFHICACVNCWKHIHGNLPVSQCFALDYSLEFCHFVVPVVAQTCPDSRVSSKHLLMHRWRKVRALNVLYNYFSCSLPSQNIFHLFLYRLVLKFPQVFPALCVCSFGSDIHVQWFSNDTGPLILTLITCNPFPRWNIAFIIFFHLQQKSWLSSFQQCKQWLIAASTTKRRDLFFSKWWWIAGVYNNITYRPMWKRLRYFQLSMSIVLIK